jgi:hypothetical protein
MVLTAATGAKLGELLLSLIRWKVAAVIDMTAEDGDTTTEDEDTTAGDKVIATFEPPAGTTVVPGQIPSNILALINENAIYSMCVSPLPPECVGKT